MPTTMRSHQRLLPPPTAGAVALAVLAGGLFAAVAWTVDREGASRLPQRTGVVHLEQAVRSKHERTLRLLRKIETKVAAEGDRSAAPLRSAIIVVQRPSRVASAPATGIWSAERERWRDSWREWADRRLKE